MATDRESIRLKNYDYSSGGMYFITVCTHKHECLFGEIQKNRRGTIFCALNERGKFVEQCWGAITQHYNNVVLDKYIVMPNHVHGILFIKNNGVQDIEPLRNEYQHIISGSIGAIIRGFKIGVTRWFRENTNIQIVWQRNYHDHIIREEKDLNRIREYIMNNPLKWQDDEYYD